MYSVYVFNKENATWKKIHMGSTNRDEAIMQAANLAGVDIRAMQKAGRRAFIESLTFEDMITFKVIDGKYQIQARYGVYKDQDQ